VGVKVGGKAVRSVEAWVTDGTRDCDALGVEVAADGSVSAVVPGRSMVTFVLELVE
jgi:O-glycosyl hydrolase